MSYANTSYRKQSYTLTLQLNASLLEKQRKRLVRLLEEKKLPEINVLADLRDTVSDMLAQVKAVDASKHD